MKFSGVLSECLNTAKHSRIASQNIRKIFKDGGSVKEAYQQIENLALIIGPKSNQSRPKSLALAQTTFLHSLLRKGEVYEARKMSLQFARAAAKTSFELYPFSRRRLPLKTMSAIITNLINDPSIKSHNSIKYYSKFSNKSTYTFLYLLSQFPTPGALAARMFISHHTKLGDRRGLREFLLILIVGLLSAEMIGAGVALYSQWCRKYALCESIKRNENDCERLNKQSDINVSHKHLPKSKLWTTTPSNITWMPSKHLVNIILDHLHTDANKDPNKELKGDCLLHLTNLIDDRIPIANLSLIIKVLSQYPQSNEYRNKFNQVLNKLSYDIIEENIKFKSSDNVYNALLYHYISVDTNLDLLKSLLNDHIKKSNRIHPGTINTMLLSSVKLKDLKIANTIISFIKYRVNKNNDIIDFEDDKIDQELFNLLKRCPRFKPNNETLEGILKYQLKNQNYSIIPAVTFQLLPHLDLNLDRMTRIKLFKSFEQSYKFKSLINILNAHHHDLKTGLSVRVFNQVSNNIENLPIELLTTFVGILLKETSKKNFSIGWGPKKWIDKNYEFTKAELVNIKNIKYEHRLRSYRPNSALYLTNIIYKIVRNRPSKYAVKRSSNSIDEGFLSQCLKIFHKMNYIEGVNDVLLQYHLRNFNCPFQHLDRFNNVINQNPQLISETYLKSKFPLKLI